jgi:hypothetical protein
MGARFCARIRGKVESPRLSEEARKKGVPQGGIRLYLRRKKGVPVADSPLHKHGAFDRSARERAFPGLWTLGKVVEKRLLRDVLLLVTRGTYQVLLRLLRIFSLGLISFGRPPVVHGPFPLRRLQVQDPISA